MQEELKDMILMVLEMQRKQLGEGFGIKLDDQMRLTAMPEILPMYCPDFDCLPELLISLAVDVAWTEPPLMVEHVAQVCMPHF
jgi:hypothetical protein